MKQLGNLAMVCAQRPEVMMQLHGGRVSVYVGTGPERAVMDSAWDNDTEISRIVHALNFGRYAPQNISGCISGGLDHYEEELK